MKGGNNFRKSDEQPCEVALNPVAQVCSVQTASQADPQASIRPHQSIQQPTVQNVSTQIIRNYLDWLAGISTCRSAW